MSETRPDPQGKKNAPKRGVLLRALMERSLASDKRPTYFEEAGQSPL